MENKMDTNWIDVKIGFIKSWIFRNIYFVFLVIFLLGGIAGIKATQYYWVSDHNEQMDKSIRTGGMIYKDKPYKIMLSVNVNPDPNESAPIVVEKPADPTPAEIVDKGLKKLKK